MSESAWWKFGLAGRDSRVWKKFTGSPPKAVKSPGILSATGAADWAEAVCLLLPDVGYDPPMLTRTLGRNGPRVSALGLGCMGMSQSYGAGDEAESLATLHHALDREVNFLDTADVYGQGHNEELLAKVLATRRAEIFLATKFGFVSASTNPQGAALNGRPDYVRAACDASLRRLGTDVIDLYYLHRVDPATPVEETIGAMAALVRAGKVRHLGLSEAGVDSIRRAHAVHPITALQSEYSLWTRDPEDGVLAVCRELGIGFVPFSPLGRGFLTGQLRRFEDFAPDDFRRHSPRFQGENFAKNLAVVRRVGELAAAKGCTAGQLALAWVLAQSDDIVPIPGTKRRSYLEENLGALALRLTADEVAVIAAVFPPGGAAGPRYSAAMMALVGR